MDFGRGCIKSSTKGHSELVSEPQSIENVILLKQVQDDDSRAYLYF